MSEIKAGECPNCGPITGDRVNLNFPNTPICDECGEDLKQAGIIDKAVIES